MDKTSILRGPGRDGFSRVTELRGDPWEGANPKERAFWEERALPYRGPEAGAH